MLHSTSEDGQWEEGGPAQATGPCHYQSWLLGEERTCSLPFPTLRPGFWEMGRDRVVRIGGLPPKNPLWRTGSLAFIVSAGGRTDGGTSMAGEWPE